jgi:KDO2-lipid IV(A) lauroyltransferase
MLYYLALFGRWLACHIPVSVIYPLAGWAGAHVLWHLWPGRRGKLRTNLAAVLHDDPASVRVGRAARRGFANLSRYGIDFLRFSSPRYAPPSGAITPVNFEAIDRVRALGKGAILVGFHIGSWDLGLKYLSDRGYPTSVVVHNFKTGNADAFIQGLRAGSGAEIIGVDEGWARMVKALRDNRVLVMLVDSLVEKGVAVRFGSKYATLPGGPATLAIRTGAGIVTSAMVRHSEEEFTAIIGGPIEFKRTGRFTEDVVELTQRFTTAQEAFARRFIDQWYMMQPFVFDGPPEAPAGR